VINCFAHFLAQRTRELDITRWREQLRATRNEAEVEDVLRVARAHAFGDPGWLILSPSEIHSTIDALSAAEAEGYER
jgi:hypothetical protein